MVWEDGARWSAALKPEDYEINEKDRAISLTEVGMAHVEQLLGQPLHDPDRPEDVTPEQARFAGVPRTGAACPIHLQRNKDYLVQGGKVVIVDEFTGRLMPGRRWSRWPAPGCRGQGRASRSSLRTSPTPPSPCRTTSACIPKLAGMTGTALTEAEEFFKIYKLEVLPIPTNLEYQAVRARFPADRDHRER